MMATGAETILDAALELGDARNWESVRLYDVADTLGITLDDIRAHYREKEDLVDAWFDRADRAMLDEAGEEGFSGLETRIRLYCLIMAWLNALASHRHVTRHMILGKLEPGHLHFQIPALLRISRTVQWMREAAHRDATFPGRALEETVLTGIYLVSFCRWMTDETPDSESTRRLLSRLLDSASIVRYGNCRFSAPAGARRQARS